MQSSGRIPPPTDPAEAPTGNIPAYQPLVIVLVAVCSGIACDKSYPLPLVFWWWAVGGGLVLWFLLWRKGHVPLATAALLVAVAALGGGWHHCRWHLAASNDLKAFADRAARPVCLQAIALSAPRPLPAPKDNPMRVIPPVERAQLLVRPTAIRDGQQWRAVSGRCRVSVPNQLGEVLPGDRLLLLGQLSTPLPAMNPGQFDTASYLRGDGVLTVLRVDSAEAVTVAQQGSGLNLWRNLARLRERGRQVLEAHLHPQQAALASALLLGLREQVDSDLAERFLKTGTVHLLAISGLHVGTLAGFALLIALWLPVRRGWAVLAVAAVTVLYALLVDARPPVVRATVLVLISCWAICIGRQALGFNTLAAAAIVILAVNPAELFRTGAQLSFLCVATLIVAGPLAGSADYSPRLKRLLEASRSWLGKMGVKLRRFVLGMAISSTVLWAVTLPLVMNRFHILPTVALVLNPLVWLPAQLALLSGMATVLLGLILPPVAWLPAILCNLSLEACEALVRMASGLPGGHCWVPGPPDWWLAGFYGGIAVAAAFPALGRRWRLRTALLALWITVGFSISLWHRAPEQVQCTFLAVGHGAAVVVNFPSGKTLLYDAGGMGDPQRAVEIISGALWSRGLRHIDAVVLSHPDLDHYNALPGLMERFTVGVIYVPPMMFSNRGYTLDVLQEAIQQRAIPLRQLKIGDFLAVGGSSRLYVLHPPEDGPPVADNANSIVLSVEHGGHRLLLTGDLEPPGLGQLLGAPPLRCDVLQVPHHGSRRSHTPELVQWAKPRWAVISGSDRWDATPVIDSYRSAGANVLHTAACGAVTVTMGPEGVRTECFLKQ